MFATTQFVADDNKAVIHELPTSLAPATHYEEDDTQTETTAGATLSTVADPHDDPMTVASPPGYHHQQVNGNPYTAFEEQMTHPQTSRYINTYFMDGGNGFISLPMLGNTSRTASQISRLFEEWLENKIYHHPSSSATVELDHLPILQDSSELLAEDILNKLKSRPAAMAGMARVLVKVRTGHVYTYHQLEDGQPLITEGMEDFFQQFPLFVEIMIYSMASGSSSTSDKYDSSFSAPTQVLLSVENATINPENPFQIMGEIFPAATPSSPSSA